MRNTTPTSYHVSGKTGNHYHQIEIIQTICSKRDNSPEKKNQKCYLIR